MSGSFVRGLRIFAVVTMSYRDCAFDSNAGSVGVVAKIENHKKKHKLIWENAFRLVVLSKSEIKDIFGQLPVAAFVVASFVVVAVKLKIKKYLVYLLKL